VNVKYVGWLATMVLVLTGSVGAALLCAPSDSTAAEPRSGEAPRVVDADGNLQVPKDYRDTYEYLGSWAIADEKGAGAKQIHEVYASPGTIAAYRRSGRFPNGTVLVKEVRAGTTAPMTTGTVTYAQKLAGWFVMVRDSSGRHPGNKLWGDGWGWSWFNAANPSKTTSTDYKANCRPCHEPARATEWVYARGYPVLER